MMLAIVRLKKTKEMFIAYCRDDKSIIKIWSRCNGDTMLLDNWINIVELLDMTVVEAQILYPEYFI